MNKKTNTILFILGATVFNILVTLLSFVLLMLIYVKFIMVLLPETGRSWGFPIIFIAAIALSFVVSRLVLRLIIDKVDIDKYFDPIFGRKRN
jgi:hypothetical protein